MIAPIRCNDDEELEFDVRLRARPPAIRASVVLSTRFDVPGKQRQANRARFTRRANHAHNGVHRRRGKKNGLSGHPKTRDLD